MDNKACPVSLRKTSDNHTTQTLVCPTYRPWYLGELKLHNGKVRLQKTLYETVLLKKAYLVHENTDNFYRGLPDIIYWSVSLLKTKYKKNLWIIVTKYLYVFLFGDRFFKVKDVRGHESQTCHTKLTDVSCNFTSKGVCVTRPAWRSCHWRLACFRNR